MKNKRIKDFDAGEEINKIDSGYSNKNKIDIIIISPPFIPAQSGGGIMKKGYTSRPDLGPDWVGNRAYVKENIGNTLSNLANLPEGKFDLICSLPPYAVDVMRERGKAAEDFVKKWI